MCVCVWHSVNMLHRRRLRPNSCSHQRIPCFVCLTPHSLLSSSLSLNAAYFIRTSNYIPLVLLLLFTYSFIFVEYFIIIPTTIRVYKFFFLLLLRLVFYLSLSLRFYLSFSSCVAFLLLLYTIHTNLPYT